MVPNIEIDMSCESMTEEYYEELSLDENYRAFNYLVNSKRIEENSPRALVFKGVI